MLNDLDARGIVDTVGDAMGLSPVERFAVRLVAKRETGYGAGWDAKHDPPRAELGAGSNNMGALTTTSTIPENYFEHTDSRFDPTTGKVVDYTTKFSRQATPEGGFRELANVLLFKNGKRRENVAFALRCGSLQELATAMRINRYFIGTKPIAEAIEDYRSALERCYQEISTQTGENYFDDPKGPASLGGSESGQPSHSSPLLPRSLSLLCASLPVLRQGVRGDLVGVLQFELGGLEPDEIFGAQTEARLAAFQLANLIDDEPHFCGPKTWGALFARPEHSAA